MPRLRDAGKRFCLDHVPHLEFAARKLRHALACLRPCVRAPLGRQLFASIPLAARGEYGIQVGGA
jgi:hypothetical protein